MKQLCWTPLQAVQIMVGLFNIGLGAAHTDDMGSTLASVGAGFWLGVVVSGQW